MRTRQQLGLGPHDRLQIIEFGGGAGTCALNILDYLQWSHTELYANTKYTIIEISNHLHREQQRRVGRLHGKHFQSIHMAASDWRHRVDGPVFVVALEVYEKATLCLKLRQCD